MAAEEDVSSDVTRGRTLLSPPAEHGELLQAGAQRRAERCIVFYVDADEIIDVLRILHSRRDLPATLQDPNT